MNMQMTLDGKMVAVSEIYYMDGKILVTHSEFVDFFECEIEDAFEQDDVMVFFNGFGSTGSEPIEELADYSWSVDKRVLDFLNKHSLGSRELDDQLVESFRLIGDYIEDNWCDDREWNRENDSQHIYFCELLEKYKYANKVRRRQVRMARFKKNFTELNTKKALRRKIGRCLNLHMLSSNLRVRRMWDSEIRKKLRDLEE